MARGPGAVRSHGRAPAHHSLLSPSLHRPQCCLAGAAGEGLGRESASLRNDSTPSQLGSKPVPQPLSVSPMPLLSSSTLWPGGGPLLSAGLPLRASAARLSPGMEGSFYC